MISFMKKLFKTNDYNYNTPDGQGNVPLHTAVIRFNQDMLEHLLQQSHININYRNYKGETPLLLCLQQSTFHMQRLTQSQSNLDISTLLRRHIAIARKLIESGADLNARDWRGRTALHCAVENNNFEGVCMLLYYGIDVSTLCNDKKTAFTLAVCRNNLDLAEVLFDYYDDFSNSDLDDYTALYWAARHRSPLALKLVEAGADVNRVPKYDDNVLIVSLRYDNAQLFKLIWPKLEHHLLLEGRTPFIERFILRTVHFSTSDWVECMYLILESPVAFDVLYQYKNLEGNFYYLLLKLSALKVKPSDRIGIIASCLSLGLEASEQNINIAFKLYGFGKELELFIYGTDVYDRLSCNSTDLYLLPRYIFAHGDHIGFEEIIRLLHRQFIESDSDEQTANFLHSLGFFALPFDVRQQLQLQCNLNQVIHNRLNKVPELPSLLELARKKVRQYIKQYHRICQAYHMHDAVKSLNLPQRVRDVILFKTPIYK